jgi:hypothetical protein
MTASPAEAQPLHRRSIQVECFEDGDRLRVVSRLRDERPWHDTLPVLHDMALELTVRNMIIESATAVMNAFPHDECPFITPKFAALEGLSITRGFTRALRELFAGISGCQHLHELARVTGPAVFQASASLRARQRHTAGPDAPPLDPSKLLGSCHIWSAGGLGPQKLELGWRPGPDSEYPAPSVERLRAEG